MSVEYTTKLHAGTDFPAVANEGQILTSDIKTFD